MFYCTMTSTFTLLIPNTMSSSPFPNVAVSLVEIVTHISRNNNISGRTHGPRRQKHYTSASGHTVYVGQGDIKKFGEKLVKWFTLKKTIYWEFVLYLIKAMEQGNSWQSSLADPRFAKGGGGMASASINGGPQRGPAPESLVEGQGALTPWSWKLFLHFYTKKWPKVKDLGENLQLCQSFLRNDGKGPYWTQPNTSQSERKHDNGKINNCERYVISNDSSRVRRKRFSELCSTIYREFHVSLDPLKCTFWEDYISAHRGCWALKFLHALEIDQALIAHTRSGTGVPPKKF